MAEVIVNNESVKLNLNSECTVEEMVNAILNKEENQDKVLTSIKIDHKTVSESDEAKAFAATLNSHDVIEFELKSGIELAFEALDSSTEYIDTLIEKIRELTALYSKNQMAEANDKFAEVIDIMDLFIQLMSKIYKTIKGSNPNIPKETILIQNLEMHMLSVLKALLPAKEKEDIIMLCDLLEFELIDNLTQWKIKAIPQLKKMKDN